LTRLPLVIVFAAVVTAGVGVFGASTAGSIPPGARSPSGFAASASPTTCGPGGWSVVTSPKLTHEDSFLTTAADPATGAVWAFGHTAPSTSGVPKTALALAESWNGAQFTHVATPSPSPNANLVSAYFSGTGSGDAVGWMTTPIYTQAVVEHWNGTAWSLALAPDPSPVTTALYGVAGTSATDEWAVGGYASTNVDTSPLIIHSDGQSWSKVGADPTVVDGTLNAVAADAPSDAWAVGSQVEGGNLATLAEHWDGRTWTAVSTPNTNSNDNILLGIAARSPSDAWAVGEYDDTSELEPLVEHWDGRSWTIAASALPGVSNARLVSVSAVTSGDIWAVGAQITPGGNVQGASTGATIGLIAHYDGSAWSVLPNRAVTPDGSTFEGVGQGSADDVWLVGTTLMDKLVERTIAAHVCPSVVSSAGFSPVKAFGPAGADFVWSVDPASATTHTITDASGLGLYDSGPRAAGASFTATLPDAGAYPVVDHTTGAKQTVTVALHLSATSGSQRAGYVVTWGSAVPSGDAEQVQVQRPGAAAFVDWVPATTAGSATFTPDAGAGTYTFRARLTSTTTSAATNWSPSAVLTVS
jgi:hypothetical protein